MHLPEARGWICTKFGFRIAVTDVITCVNFLPIGYLREVEFVGDGKSVVSFDKACCY